MGSVQGDLSCRKCYKNTISLPLSLLDSCLQCELAVDAVHKRSQNEESGSVLPRREEITDPMIFSPQDLVTMICRDVDLNYATKGHFTTSTLTVSSFTLGSS